MLTQTSPFMTRAYAKLNLALSVGAPIDAPQSPRHGYHPICSYMHAIDLCDEVVIERLEDGESSAFEIVWAEDDGSTRPVEWAIEHDLVFRAHAALQRTTRRSLPSAVKVTKSIPAGGGLGGGSSDAACVLMGLDRVFGLGLGISALRDIAMTLGSDIAYFIDEHTPPRPAIVSGFGESIERVDTKHVGCEVTLVLPRFGCSTGGVYQAFDRLGPDAVDVSAVRRVVDSDTLVDAMLINDLTPAACIVEPRLGALIERIRKSIGRGVHVTGSGSTCFVLGRVDRACICDLVPDCRIVNTRLV